ncbi:MAG: CinY protein [Pseudomonadota bacterium]|nr:CinY protein [Pseudomonadota bacterium]
MKRLAALAVFLLIPATDATAFGSIGSLGQAAEHERITRLALRGEGFGPKTLEELTGASGRMGAVGAPDSPERGLMNSSEAHCDNADHLAIAGYPQDADTARAVLEGCRRFIMRALADAVTAAGRIVEADGRVRTSEIPSFVPCTYNGQPGRAKCDVMGALGLAFHAAQDFYSHSNWVDVPANGPVGPENPPGLGRNGPAPFLDPRQRAAFVPGLITGCFQGKPERVLCRYGSDGDRVRHRVLNKDTGFIDDRSGAIGEGTSPRGAVNGNFRRAVEAAIADTRAKWRYFAASVVATYGKARGERIICAIRNDDEDACR